MATEWKRFLGRRLGYDVGLAWMEHHTPRFEQLRGFKANDSRRSWKRDYPFKVGGHPRSGKAKELRTPENDWGAKICLLATRASCYLGKNPRKNLGKDVFERGSEGGDSFASG